MSQAKPTTEVERFNLIASRMYAGVMSDILDEMGFRDQAITPRAGLVPLCPGSVFLGRALTVLNDFDSRLEDPYELAIEALETIQPGQVTVATGTAPLECGIFGELSATRLRAKGAVGALIDGYTRDARRLIQMEYPVFCRGTSPIDTTGRVRVVDYNVPIKFANRTIEPNQVIFADADGILLIPREAEDEVLEKALERIDVESLVRAELASGGTMETVWEKYHVL